MWNFGGTGSALGNSGANLGGSADNTAQCDPMTSHKRPFKAAGSAKVTGIN